MVLKSCPSSHVLVSVHSVYTFFVRSSCRWSWCLVVLDIVTEITGVGSGY